jgi:hypothetical protein
MQHYSSPNKILIEILHEGIGVISLHLVTGMPASLIKRQDNLLVLVCSKQLSGHA